MDENQTNNQLVTQPLGSSGSHDDAEFESSKAENPWLFAPLPVSQPKIAQEFSKGVGLTDSSFSGANGTFDADALKNNINPKRDIAKSVGSALSYIGNRPESEKVRVARSQNVTAPQVLADYHAKNVSDLMKEAEIHKGNISATKDNFNNALQNALQKGAIPEDPAEVQNLFGQKFTYPGMLSVGAEKNVEHNVQQRQGNKVQSGVEGVRDFKGMGPASGYVRSSRLIVPYDLGTAPLLTKDQIEARDALKKAHEEHQNAIDEHLEHQKVLEKANEDLKKATLDKIEGEAKFSGYQPTKAIQVLKGLAKGLGGLGSGLSLYDAYDKLKQGDYTGLADLSMGVGGGMMLIPGLEPLGVAVALPGAAYTGGKSALELYHRYADQPTTK